MIPTDQEKQCGFISVVGRPNVGKSSTMNAIMGRRFLITSHHPQTTQHAIRLIFQKDQKQIVLVDTPGLHSKKPFLLNQRMNQSVYFQISDCDAIVWVIDATRFALEDQKVLEAIQVRAKDKMVFLVINKIDLLDSIEQSLVLIDRFQALYDFKSIIPISARKKYNIDRLVQLLLDCTPHSKWFFEEGKLTDRRENFLISEFIRESIIRHIRQEVVYAVAVEIREVKKLEGCLHIHADIWVDKQSQKPIILGKKGLLLKKIGTQSRHSIETLLNCHVCLKLWVRVKNNWRNQKHLLDQLV